MDFFRGLTGGINSHYTIQSYPRDISPQDPDSSSCVPEYGRGLNKKDCKGAVKNMPWARQGAEVEWAVNFKSLDYNLPMSIGWTVPRGEDGAGAPGNCVISIEVAGPQAFYDTSINHVPFTIRASPFQLRGLAAHVVNNCVTRGGGVGGFATNQRSRLAEYLKDPNTDLSAPYPISAHYITVSVKGVDYPDPQPGCTHPSIAVFIAEYLSNVMRGADNAVQKQLGGIIRRMVVVAQRMSPGGNTPWWQQVPDSADKMNYECDAKLGMPSAIDCAKVEYGQSDHATFSVGAGVAKILSSGTCQVVITAATSITLNWRQIRTALDTLFNFCIHTPIGTGGRATFRPPAKVSRRSQWWKRQNYDDLSGLNALPPGAAITVKGIPLRPPERELGANYTSEANSTVLVNTTYAVPAL